MSPYTMDNVDVMHRLTTLQQYFWQLEELVDDAQVALVKVLTEDQMRLALLRRYPMRLAQRPPTVTSLLEKIDEILPHVREFL